MKNYIPSMVSFGIILFTSACVSIKNGNETGSTNPIVDPETPVVGGTPAGDNPIEDIVDSIASYSILHTPFAYKDGGEYGLQFDSPSGTNHVLPINNLSSFPSDKVIYLVLGNFTESCKNVAQILRDLKNGVNIEDQYGVDCVAQYSSANAVVRLGPEDTANNSVTILSSPEQLATENTFFTMTISGSNQVAGFSSWNAVTYVQDALSIAGYRKVYLPREDGTFTVQAEDTVLPQTDSHPSPQPNGWVFRNESLSDSSGTPFADYTGNGYIFWSGVFNGSSPGHYPIEYHFYLPPSSGSQCLEMGVRNKHGENSGSEFNDFWFQFYNTQFNGVPIASYDKYFSNQGGSNGSEFEPLTGLTIGTASMWNCNTRKETSFGFNGMTFSNHPQAFGCFDEGGIKSFEVSGRSQIFLDAFLMKPVAPPNDPNQGFHPISCWANYQAVEASNSHIFIK